VGINFDLKYPERVRCGKCRKYFAWVVFQGVFCSRECAELPPVDDPDDWPRQHYVIGSNGVKREKRDWQSMGLAKEKAKKFHKTAYRCDYCLGWHIGSLNPNKKPEQARIEIVTEGGAR
jgi:endogenous inhibitor of DNA gyrase (YacG/DUF329 family)